MYHVFWHINNIGIVGQNLFSSYLNIIQAKFASTMDGAKEFGTKIWCLFWSFPRMLVRTFFSFEGVRNVDLKYVEDNIITHGLKYVDLEEFGHCWVLVMGK